MTKLSIGALSKKMVFSKKFFLNFCIQPAVYHLQVSHYCHSNSRYYKNIRNTMKMYKSQVAKSKDENTGDGGKGCW